MSPSKTESKSIESKNELEVIRITKKTGDIMVKHHQSGNICAIVDTFAEMYHNNESLSSVLDKLPIFFCLLHPLKRRNNSGELD